MPHSFTRVTLLGAHRHADVLLPSSEPVGSLMPQILDLLGDAPGHRVAVKTLVTVTGDVVPADATLGSAAIPDGATLQLLESSETPPPPVIYDVADAAVDQSEQVTGRWTPLAGRIACAVFFAVFVVFAGFLLVGAFLTGHRGIEMVFDAPILYAIGLGVAAARQRIAGIALIIAGWILAVIGLWQIHLHPDLLLQFRHEVWLMAAATAVGLVALAFTMRGAKVACFQGAGTIAGLTIVWIAADLLTADAARTAAVGAVISLLVLGLVPRIALSASGLAGLDDKHSAGRTVGRRDAVTAVQAAHRGLALGVVVCAVSLAIAVWILSADSAHRVWSLPLAAVIALATGLRSRSFPLIVERGTLLAAMTIGFIGLALAGTGMNSAMSTLVAVAVLVVAVAVALIGAGTFPAHVAARLRVGGNRFETVLILASVPLTVGMFGVFGDLLQSFN